MFAGLPGGSRRLHVAVIVSTLTLGWHYLIDVAGGVVLAVAALWLVSALGPWLYDSEGESRRWRPLAGASATSRNSP